MRYRIPIYRVALVKERTLRASDANADGPAAVARIVRRHIGATDREHFVVLFLNAAHDVVGVNTVSIGTLTASLVHPREVFKGAILANAAAVVVAHNHPSGDPSPSREDKLTTRRLVDAGKLLGIPLLDHVVLGDGNRHHSFREVGAL